MQTSFRDNAIAKNHFLLRIMLLWALCTTAAVIVMSGLCFYVVTHKQTHWLPICTGSEFSIGDSAFSPTYLKEMTQKAADLRLTYNPETIESRHKTLSHLIPANHLDAFKRLLDAEKNTVLSKNISSVFYAEEVLVDVQHATGKIKGQLVRTSHGLQLKPQHKTYLLQFSFKNGLLGLESIKELIDETRH